VAGLSADESNIFRGDKPTSDRSGSYSRTIYDGNQVYRLGMVLDLDQCSHYLLTNTEDSGMVFSPY
jgi:hypothetical protein